MELNPLLLPPPGADRRLAQVHVWEWRDTVNGVWVRYPPDVQAQGFIWLLGNSRRRRELGFF